MLTQSFVCRSHRTPLKHSFAHSILGRSLGLGASCPVPWTIRAICIGQLPIVALTGAFNWAIYKLLVTKLGAS